MSAFVVGTETMDRCVAALISRDAYGHPIVQTFGGIATQEKDAPTRIGRALFAMNRSAVRQRYPDTVSNPSNMPGPEDADTLHKTYTYTPPQVTKPVSVADRLADGIAALVCLDYQCSEGNVPSKRLYKELEKATGLLAIAAVKDTAAYKAADWD